MSTRSLVLVIDDDESVRESLPDLLAEFGFSVRAFSSAAEFLASECVSQAQCLILDIALPGMSGPDLWREMRRQGRDVPTIFITGRASEAVRAALITEGAVECLFKPFSDTDLREALDKAFRAK